MQGVTSEASDVLSRFHVMTFALQNVTSPVSDVSSAIPIMTSVTPGITSARLKSPHQPPSPPSPPPSTFSPSPPLPPSLQGITPLPSGGCWQSPENEVRVLGGRRYYHLRPPTLPSPAHSIPFSHDREFLASLYHPKVLISFFFSVVADCWFKCLMICKKDLHFCVYSCFFMDICMNAYICVFWESICMYMYVFPDSLYDETIWALHLVYNIHP